MYKRLGAPVEKVLAFLTDFRARQRSQKDQYNIDWMMEVCARSLLARLRPHACSSLCC